MKRLEIPQLTDQPWFPEFLRQNIFEFMTWFVGVSNAAKPFLPVINEGLTHAKNIIALQMPVGAGFETLEPLLDKNIPVEKVNLAGFSASKNGLYVSVNAFHKLDPKQATALLTKISASGNPVAIVEGNNDSLWQAFGMLVLVPLSMFLTAPFVKPFRLSRIIFTYLIPVLPIITAVDGFIALFKLYAPKDLVELTSNIPVKDYSWRTGKLDNGRGGKIIYLLGYPYKSKF